MAYYKIPDPEQLIQCPYDRTHMRAAKRMQYHLIKCRKNFTGREFGTCPFNARHEMPKPDLQYHIANCPDKAMLEHILSYEQSKLSEDGKNFKGCTDLPKYDQSFDSRNVENWDEEIPENPRIGVDPAYFARLEYKDLSGMRKSERKKWKQQYTLPPDQRQCPMQESKEEEEEGQLRKPHIMPSKFMQAQPLQQPSQVLSYSLAMAGIGRGGAGLESQTPQGIGRAVGRVENAAGIGRAVGRSENMPGVVRALGKGDNIPGVGRAMGRATAMHNYVQRNTVNGGLTNGFTQSNMEDTNGNEILEKTAGLDDQFDDYDLQENCRPGIKKEVATTPAGIGCGGGAPPTSQFSVGIGRGMLRDLHLNGSPSFVLPIVTNTIAVPPSDSAEPEGSINAVRSLDAKNKERKKIEKKLKQIELLEEKGGKGYKYNDEEKMKLGAKDNLLKALEAI